MEAGGRQRRARRGRPRAESKVENQLDDFGNLMLSFANIGFFLYVISFVTGIEFDRFLGMVFLLGLAMLASRPQYNPNLSATIEHDLTANQIACIRAFTARRLRLRRAIEDGVSTEERDRAFEDLTGAARRET